jgi:hypothetical protein
MNSWLMSFAKMSSGNILNSKTKVQKTFECSKFLFMEYPQGRYQNPYVHNIALEHEHNYQGLCIGAKCHSYLRIENQQH